ncbi:sugar phosphate isomerase/epimerase family protein [Aeromonas veronii]
MFECSVSNIAWSREEELEAFEVLKQQSITNLEVAPARVVSNLECFSMSEVREYRDYCRLNGLSISSMQALLFGGPNLNIFGSNDDREILQKYLLNIIEMGHGLGASKLVFGSPKNRLKGGLGKDDSFDVAASFFEPLARKAAGYGCEICIENNPTYYGADFLTTTQEVCDFIIFSDIKGLGAHFDTGGMFLSGENYENSLISNKELISHVHVSEKDLLPLSIGNIDHKVIANTLKGIGYNKVVSLEMKRSNKSIYDLGHSIKIINEIYR